MKTNKGLVAHAKMMLEKKAGYVLGTFCIPLTEALLQQKIHQLPEGVGKYEPMIRQKWMGRLVTDCVGLIKGYLWWDAAKGQARYNKAHDLSADKMYAKAVNKGPIGTLPELQGIGVWKKGHIGVYIGGGQVIEARGTRHGVIQSTLTGKGAAGWTHWLQLPFIEYPQAPLQEPKPTPSTAAKPILKRGMSGESVKQLQEALRGAGYTIITDGVFGPATEATVRMHQRKAGLTADGIVGPKTWGTLK